MLAELQLCCLICFLELPSLWVASSAQQFLKREVELLGLEPELQPVYHQRYSQADFAQMWGSPVPTLLHVRVHFIEWIKNATSSDNNWGEKPASVHAE
jgi:hypothetical protein